MGMKTWTGTDGYYSTVGCYEVVLRGISNMLLPGTIWLPPTRPLSLWSHIAFSASLDRPKLILYTTPTHGSKLYPQRTT